MTFNADAAADVYDLVCKMDDDSALMFVRAVNYDLLTHDLDNNKRFVTAAVESISKEMHDELVEITKRKDDHWKAQPRDESGQWTVTFSRTKKKGGDINVTQALSRAGGETSRFAEKWNQRAQYSDSAPTAQTYSRIQAGAALAENIPNAKAKAAAQLGRHIGQYGPEAEKVIGPTLRRTAYRYRGTERTPDKVLIDAQRDQAKQVMRADGLREEQFGVPERFEASTKAAISYLGNRLPSKGLAGLQQASGKIPPSEGVILNADGKIITQAVGYSDDHYLPFNLKNLRGLQGGAYIRSRSSGGLTTEDIYTGLMSGARSVTVVSRSGVFTVNFDDEFRGGRRYNDKAAQMVSRYAKTLDAVKSEQVTRKSVTPEQKAQIRDEVESEFGKYSASQEEIEDEIKRRVKDFKVSNIPTKSEVEEIDRKAFEAAATGGNLKTGSVAGRDVGPKPEHIPDDLKSRYSMYRSQMLDELMDEKAARQYQLDGEGYAVAMDALKEQFPYYIDSVSYIHRKDPRFSPDVRHRLSAEKDAGYVKPKYIRPEGALEGYYDKSIAASGRGGKNGKISADRTNFQNWTHNPERATKVDEESGPAQELKAAVKASPREKAQILAQGEQVATAVKAQNDSLRQMAKIYSPIADVSQHRELTMAADDETLNQLLSQPASRQKLLDQVRDVHSQLNTADATPGQQAARNTVSSWLQTYDDAESAVGGTHWDRGNVVWGQSPKAPYQYNYDEGGGVFVPGAEAGRYEDAKARLQSKIGLNVSSRSDEDLRHLSEFYGTLRNQAEAAASGKASQADAVQQLNLKSADLPADLHAEVRTYSSRLLDAFADPELAHRMTKMSEDQVDNIERLRRVRLASGRPLHHPQGIETKEMSFDSSTPNQVAAVQAIDSMRQSAEAFDHPDADALGALSHALRHGSAAEIDSTIDSMNESESVKRILRQHGYDV